MVRGRGSLAYKGTDPRSLELDMEKVGKLEESFAAVPELLLHRQKHEAALRLQFVEGEVGKLDALGHTAAELSNMDFGDAEDDAQARQVAARRFSVESRRQSVEALAAADMARASAGTGAGAVRNSLPDLPSVGEADKR